MSLVTMRPAVALLGLVLFVGCSVELKGSGADNGPPLGGGDGEGTGGDGDLSMGDGDQTSDEDASTKPDEPALKDAGEDLEDAATPAPMGFQPVVGEIGSRCTQDSDCGGFLGGGSCAKQLVPFIGSRTGYCSRRCYSQGGNECGAGALCVGANNSDGNNEPGRCHRLCQVDDDCRIEDGYHCDGTLIVFKLCWAF